MSEESKEISQPSPYNLFNNPMVNAAKKSMTSEDIANYQKLGEEFYKNIDFEKCEVNNLPPLMHESFIYIDSMIKSGYHPSMMEVDEKNLMKEVLGENWYEKYGYVEGDLNDIVTLKFE